jgi:hypothetical protein
MAYTPVIPLSGVAGWRFLQRTEAKQQAAFENSAVVKADVAYFTEKIAGVKTAEDLVSDRRLLKVALGAFGLSDKIDAKAFIRKVLEEGTELEGAFANRLADKTYAELAAAFGFGNPSGGQTATNGFAAAITAAYKKNAFQEAVGEVSNTMRLAMNLKNKIGELSAGEGESWYAVLGSKPLRDVFETAYGLPASFVSVDIDQQRNILAKQTEQLFGSDGLSVFQDAEVVDKLVNRFLAMAQISGKDTSGSTSGGSVALSLLQGGSGSGSQGILNLLYAS